jgi:prepilin-type N-terminal cleavage/methylation domain-containing protein
VQPHFAAQPQGLTLAEVLVALAILSVGLVSMISLLPLAASGVHQGAHRSAAIFLASERLEQVKHTVGLAEYGQDALSETATWFPDEPALPAPHGDFSRTVRVRDCGEASGCSGLNTPGVRQISVRVAYPAPAGQVAGVSRDAVLLSTYIGVR